MTATATRCRRCNRQLRTAASVAAGIGPTCARRERAEVEAVAALEAAIADVAAAYGYSAPQAGKALEAFEDGAVVLDLDGHPHALVVSEDGTRIHRVAIANLRCNCEAGAYGRGCYHALATLAALQLGEPAPTPSAPMPAAA